MEAWVSQQGAIYVPSQSTNTSIAGPFLSTFGIRVATFEATFDTTSIDVAGSLYLEYTGGNAAVPTFVTRVLLPTGSFHTNLAGWAFDTNNIGLKLTAGAAQQGCVSLSISHPLVGRMRCGWARTAGGGAGNNTLTITAQGWGP